MQKLGDLVNIKTGKLDANAADPDGVYPFFTCAIKPLRINTYAYDCECSLVAGNGDLNVKYYNGKFNAYQRVYIIESKDKSILDTKFQTRFLDTCLRGLRSKTKGAVIQFIRLGDLTGLKLLLPSLEDQLHITNILSKAENLIAQRKESIRLLDVFLKSTFLEMFGDGKTNVKGFPIVKIEDISTEIKDGPHVSPKYSETGIPIFSSRNIKPGELVMEEIKYVSEEMYLELTKRFKPQRDDVLVTKGGTTGFAKVVDFDFPFCIWVHIAAIRPSKKVVPIYLEHYINSDYGYYQTQKNTKGAANRDLGLKKIAKIEMPLPPIELQTQFAQIVEKTEALKTQYQQSLQELANLYGSLSQRAFNGEL